MPPTGRIRQWLGVAMTALALLTGLVTSAHAEMSRGFRRLMDAVVRIDVREVAYEAGTQQYSYSIGSGVIISKDGLILTNAHVVSPRAIEISVTLASLERVSAHLVGWDHWTDLAVLKLDAAEVARRKLTFTHARFGNSDRLYVGEDVYAVGTPHGLSRTVTRGIISNKDRYFQDNYAVRGYETGAFNTWLQTDAAINPGNSGGPLVLSNGEVIGINSRGYIGADNLGFAIPGNVAKAVAQGLVDHGRITRSYAGLVFGALQDLERFYDLSVNTGVLVNSVDVGSPAAKAGVRGGDIVLAIDGVKVDGRFPEQLPPIQARIAALPVGSTLTLRVKHGNEVRTVSMVTERLESRVGEEYAFVKWGVSVRKVSRTYARENQLPNDVGMLVIGIQPGFPADVAGLARGDIITSIDQKPITTLAVAKSLYAGYERKPAPTLVEARRARTVSLYVMKP